MPVFRFQVLNDLKSPSALLSVALFSSVIFGRCVEEYKQILNHAVSCLSWFHVSITLNKSSAVSLNLSITQVTLSKYYSDCIFGPPNNVLTKGECLIEQKFEFKEAHTTTNSKVLPWPVPRACAHVLNRTEHFKPITTQRLDEKDFWNICFLPKLCRNC